MSYNQQKDRCKTRCLKARLPIDGNHENDISKKIIDGYMKNRTFKFILYNTFIDTEFIGKEKEYVKSVNKCNLCNKKTKLTLDHIIPLSLGGIHAKENIQILCKSCNSKKHNKLIFNKFEDINIKLFSPYLHNLIKNILNNKSDSIASILDLAIKNNIINNFIKNNNTNISKIIKNYIISYQLKLNVNLWTIKIINYKKYRMNIL